MGRPFNDSLRDLWKRTAVVVEHPVSGLVCVIAIVLWAVFGIVKQFDSSLTYLGAACNALQTFLLFVIAAAQAAHAVDALAHAKAAHAHAAAAHERLDDIAPEPQTCTRERHDGPCNGYPCESVAAKLADQEVREAERDDVLSRYGATPLPAGRTPRAAIEAHTIGYRGSVNVAPGDASRTIYYTQLASIATAERVVAAADGLPWLFIVTISWNEVPILTASFIEILVDRLRMAVAALDCVEGYSSPGDPIYVGRPEISTNTHLSQYETAHAVELSDAMDDHNLRRSTSAHEALHDGA